MVSYQKFVSIVFDMVEADDLDDGAEVMSWASERWNRNKETLQTATEAEAKDLVRRTLQ